MRQTDGRAGMLRAMLAVLIAVLLPGGGRAEAAAASARPMLRVGLQLEPPNLDPTGGAAAATDEVISGTVLESLTTLDRAGTPRPMLATAWTVSADGLTYRLALRPGVRFTDGTRFDAATARASLLRAIAPGSANSQREALSVIRAIEADGPLGLILRLRRPDADLLRTLAYGDAAMVSPRSLATLATAPVGTGPFRVEAWRRGESITLVRNPGWWGPPPPLTRVRFRFIADPTAAYAAVRAHDVDLFVDFPAPESIARLRREPGLRVTIGPTQAETILALNNARPPFSSLAVRRAIAQAIDRRAVIDGAMEGFGTPIGSHFPPQDPAYVDLTGRYPHDTAAAARVLKGLGPVTLSLPPPPYARRSGEIVAAQLRAAGLDVRIEDIEWAQWLDRVYARRQYDMTIVAHVEPYDYQVYGRPDYYFGYDGRAVARLIAETKATADPVRQRALLQGIQRRIADDSVNGFLFEMARLGVADASLAGIWVDTPLRAVDYAAARFVGPAEARAAAEEARRPALPWGLILLGGAAALALAVGMALGARRLAARAGVLLVTLVGASLVIFLLLQVAPGDPAQFMMGLEATPQAIAALHAELGLEGPAWRRYLGWIAGLLRGDLGLSYTYRVPVAGLIGERLAVSLPLAGLAMLLSVVLAIPAALVAARRPEGRADRLLMGAAQLGLAIPGYWLALLLVLLFSVTLGWAGGAGFPGWDAGAGPALGALLLPAVALGVPQAAVIARVARAAIGHEMDGRYILTARAKGVGERRLLAVHALPNAAAPILTVLGLQFPFLLSGSVIVETVFALPGLGRLILQAIAQRDMIVVQAAVMLMVAGVVLTSFLIDIAAVAIDPRLRRA